MRNSECPPLRHEKETDIEDLAELEREYAVLHWDLDEVNQTFGIVNAYLEEHPDSDTMRLFKVDLCLRESAGKEALRIAKQLAKEQPDDLSRKMKLGACYETLDYTDKAIKVYNEILEKTADYVPAIRRLMYVYSYKSNRYKDLYLCRKGIEYADRMIELTDSAEAYLEKGNLQIDLYELEGAVDSCRKAIERNQEAYYAYNNLGCALLKLRRVEEAVAPLLQAVELDPDREPLPYMNLAECYSLLKEYDKAIEMYERALQFRPKSERVKEDIAKLQVKKRDYDKAVVYYKNRIKAITSQHTGKGILFWKRMDIQEEELLLSLYCDIADVYRQAGKDDRAEAYYEKVIERWKSPLKAKISCEHLADVAEYYRDKGELKKAENIVRKAYQRCSDENEDRIVALCLVFAVVIFFWMAFHQNGLTLTLFAEEYTATHSSGLESMAFDVTNLLLCIVIIYALFSLFQSKTGKGKGISGIVILACLAALGYKYTALTPDGISIQAPIFQQFNPCFVVGLTPVSMAIFGWLASKGKEPSAPRKIGLGMLVAGIGYVVMILASIGVGEGDRVSPNWLILTYLILTFGELC